jgi:serine/threonine-protein kinase
VGGSRIGTAQRYNRPVSEATPTLPLGPSGELDPNALVGSLLDGRYRLIAHLASGGMGAVFRAEHVHMGKAVAVKVLRPDLTTSDEMAERFRREARIYAAIDHANVVRVSDIGRTRDGLLYLAMEYLEGESLRDRLDREGALGVDDALALLLDIASALGAAHRRGVVHRDLKPENVFLARSGGKVIVKVLDFGIAKVTTPEGDLTRLGTVLGSPKYIAPEQALGLAVDARADVYALGVLAWRMLAGRHPFEGKGTAEMLLAQATAPIPPLGDACPALASHPVAAVIAEACAKEAPARPRDGDALRDRLEACRSGSHEERTIVLSGPAAVAIRAWTSASSTARRTWTSNRVRRLRAGAVLALSAAWARARAISARIVERLRRDPRP